MEENKSIEVLGALERLQRLKESGLLTEAEVAEQKARILAGTPYQSNESTASSDPLFVRPETIRAITQQSSENSKAKVVWIAVIVLFVGIGGLIIANTPNLTMPTIPSMAIGPEPEMEVSTGELSIRVTSRMAELVINGVTINEGQCEHSTPTEQEAEAIRSFMASKGSVSDQTIDQISKALPSIAEAKVKSVVLNAETLTFPIKLKMGQSKSFFPGLYCNVITVVVHSPGWDTKVVF
jgi:hypothetical protein